MVHQGPAKLRGNAMSGNKTESRREENLPLRGSPRGLRKPPRGTLVMRTKSQKGTSRRFSEVLSESVSERTLSPVAPHRIAP